MDDDTPFDSLLTHGGQLASTTSQVLTSHKVDPIVPLTWQTGFHFKQHNVEVNLGNLYSFIYNMKLTIMTLLLRMVLS